MWHRLSVAVLAFLLYLTVLPAAAIDEAVSPIPGSIAVIGEDFNIYTYDFNAQRLNALTSDASRVRRYQWPTWSPDGRLAYFCCDLRSASSLDSEAFISPDGISAGQLSYRGSNEAVIYAAWSPASCGDDCRDLAMLINNVQAGSLGVEMLRDSNTDSGSSRIASGSPFYYHWDTSGTQLVFHRNNRTIDIYSLAQDDISATYRISGGNFQTPAWSPVDDRILVTASSPSGATTDLVLLEDGETRILVSDLAGFISFSWSPDGRYVAYRTFERDSVGPVYVADSRTGAIIAASDVPGAVAFFWSPDSRKLAYITPQQGRGQSASLQRIQDETPVQFLWSVLDIEQGENLRYSSFIPTYEMGYLIIYFDQFVPSHRIWSPDSRYLVYSTLLEVSGRVQAQVRIQDTRSGDTPQTLANGVLGIWSFE